MVVEESKFKERTKVAQGKTKELYTSPELESNLVIVKSKDDITKNDNASLTEKLTGKAEFSTWVTCVVFELLKRAGIPVAYEYQLSPTEFIAQKCQMIWLEVIMRRYAVGSYLKRFPQLERGKNYVPFRFHQLVFELFLKTTGGKVLSREGLLLKETPLDFNSDSGLPIDDPFIKDHRLPVWHLMHPKVPGWEQKADLNISISPLDILPDLTMLSKIEEITRKTFLVLEGAWAQLGLRLIDFKIEFGITPDGKLVVADVIDNDSWRLRDTHWQELSKQLFRDNLDMKFIEEKYAVVSNLVSKFSVSEQALVIWKASETDTVPEMPKISGVSVKEVVASGHKSTLKCLQELEDTLAAYPQGGVIITFVGMSNGLGPILAAHTNWSVISVPTTAKERPHDTWSNLEMPSHVPLLTVLSPNNAVEAAFNILARTNPIVYMERQYAIEKLDGNRI